MTIADVHVPVAGSVRRLLRWLRTAKGIATVVAGGAVTLVGYVETGDKVWHWVFPPHETPSATIPRPGRPQLNVPFAAAHPQLARARGHGNANGVVYTVRIEQSAHFRDAVLSWTSSDGNTTARRPIPPWAPRSLALRLNGDPVERAVWVPIPLTGGSLVTTFTLSPRGHPQTRVATATTAAIRIIQG